MKASRPVVMTVAVRFGPRSCTKSLVNLCEIDGHNLAHLVKCHVVEMERTTVEGNDAQAIKKVQPANERHTPRMKQKRWRHSRERPPQFRLSFF